MVPQSNLCKQKILLLGINGMVGFAISEELKKRNMSFYSPRREELDLLDVKSADAYLKDKKIDIIINAAGHVGSQYLNTQKQIDFYYFNSVIQNNLLFLISKNKIKKIVSFNSANLHTDNTHMYEIKYEKISEHSKGYLLAKKHLINSLLLINEKEGVNFLCLFLPNIFGIKDNFSLSPRFIPNIIKKIHEAKIKKNKKIKLSCLSPFFMETMFNKDLAVNLVNFLESYHFEKDFVNFSTGQNYDLSFLISKIKEVVEFDGQILIDKLPNKERKKEMNIDFLKSIIEVQRTDILTSLKETYLFSKDRLI